MTRRIDSGFSNRLRPQMRLTRHTDYSLRVLIYLATHVDKSCAIAEIATAYRISYNHLMKVATVLAHAGFVEAQRGRGGGLKLAKPAAKIRVGDVVRVTEEGLRLADCDNCTIAPVCGLTGVLVSGVNAMLKVFDSYTVADLALKRNQLNMILGQPERRPLHVTNTQKEKGL
jgi:Rrf2 family transcriptional regulator, nitric oxide-sensitive transcriptional repressor